MLDISKDAQAFLRALPPKQYKQVAARILELPTNPDPHDSKHMAGHPGYKRIDQGEYRIIYRVDNGVVRVPTVGKRNDDEVYRKFERR
jgi:mRNA interferase RelE/StbE